jgi:GNAT superfamily N-acetyltransferase
VWALVLEFASYVKLDHVATGSAAQMREHLFGGAWPRLDGFIAEDSGQVVGYALWFGTFSSFRTQPMLFLEDLYVASSHRGSGAGFALFQVVAREALARGCLRMQWGVLKWNEGAIAFYDRLGATRVAEDEHAFQLEGEALTALVGRGSDASTKR